MYKKEIKFFRSEILNISALSNNNQQNIGLYNSSAHTSINNLGNSNTSLISTRSNINNTNSNNISLTQNINFNMNLANCNSFENFKNIEFLKEFIIAYSDLTEVYYFVILNKIFLIENSFHEFTNNDKDFNVSETIYKNLPITYFIIEDPYAFIFMDNKIHIHFITDLKKPLEIINLEYTFSLTNNKICYKKINEFFKQTKSNLFSDLIEYNDVFQMNRLRSGRTGETILNSCQHLFLIYETKNFKLDWFYSRSLEMQLSILKRINFLYSCKYLGYYCKLLNNLIKEETEDKNYKSLLAFANRNSAINCIDNSNNTLTHNNTLYTSIVTNTLFNGNSNMIPMQTQKNFLQSRSMYFPNNSNNTLNSKALENSFISGNISVENIIAQKNNYNNAINLDLFRSFYFPSNNFINILNEKFILKNSLILLYSLISINDYARAKILLEEVKIDKIFIIILLKNFVNSKKILFILDRLIRNISIIEDIHDLINKSYSENNNFGNMFEIQSQNQILIFRERYCHINNIDIQLPDLIDATLIKTEKDLSIFLKGFFNTLIFYRNDLKIYLNKFRRKNLDGELIVKKFISENLKLEKLKREKLYSNITGGPMLIKSNQNQENNYVHNNVNGNKRKAEHDFINENDYNFELESSRENKQKTLADNDDNKNVSFINNAQVRKSLGQEEKYQQKEYYNLNNLENLKNLNEVDSEIANINNNIPISIPNQSPIIDLDNIDVSLNTNEIINKVLQGEIELRYLIIENLIFICNYYSFKSTSNQKYSDNLKLMIKISHNILDKDFINLLQNSDLDQEILLFYYYKGNYSQCLNKIVSIYDSLEKIEIKNMLINNTSSNNENNNYIRIDIDNNVNSSENEINLPKFDTIENLDNNLKSESLKNTEEININSKPEDEKTHYKTRICISKPGLNLSSAYNNRSNEEIYIKKSNTLWNKKIENLTHLKKFSTEIAIEKLGYSTDIESSVNFINKQALLENNDENDVENKVQEDNNFGDNNNNNSKNINIKEEVKNSDFVIKVDKTILSNNSNNITNLARQNSLSKAHNQSTKVKNIEKMKNQWFIRYINLINLISPKIQKVELMEYMKWALAKNALRTIDILFENKIISNSKIENDFLEILKPFGIDAVIYYLKFILGNNKIEEPSHQNEIINLYTLKLNLLYQSLEKDDNIISNFNEHFHTCKKKIKSILFALI